MARVTGMLKQSISDQNVSFHDLCEEVATYRQLQSRGTGKKKKIVIYKRQTVSSIY